MMTESEARRKCERLGMDYGALVQWGQHPNGQVESLPVEEGRRRAHEFIRNIACPVPPIIESTF